MQWADDALVMGCRPIGEARSILEVLTPSRGRHLGVVHGGRRLAPVLQPGNLVRVVWRARLDEQLGSFAVEPLRLNTDALIASRLALAGLAALVAHLRLLPERDPHGALFDQALALVAAFGEPDLGPALFVRFELSLLAELGFGLDLAACAATGATQDLVYVSPRTGRAVGRAAGLPYHDRLLALPAFLAGPAATWPGAAEIERGLDLTGHFLDLHVFGPRAASRAERDRFVAAWRAGRAPAAPSGMVGRPDSARDP